MLIHQPLRPLLYLAALLFQTIYPPLLYPSPSANVIPTCIFVKGKAINRDGGGIVGRDIEKKGKQVKCTVE